MNLSWRAISKNKTYNWEKPETFRRYESAHSINAKTVDFLQYILRLYENLCGK